MTTPHDHNTRLQRAVLSLEGLALGDAFGGRFTYRDTAGRHLPPPIWYFSDDTVMALGVVAILSRHTRIETEPLARLFAANFQADPYRGYGQSVRRVLDRIAEGVPWSVAARESFGGTGSMGNGGAMRVAPLGAYYADDLSTLVEQARASAEVTHAHPEGQAGAIATALAAAWAWNHRSETSPQFGRVTTQAVVPPEPLTPPLRGDPLPQGERDVFPSESGENKSHTSPLVGEVGPLRGPGEGCGRDLSRTGGVDTSTRSGQDLLAFVVEHTPLSETRTGIEKALALGPDRSIVEATTTLGNGSRITAPDTVPFALWCAARHIDDYSEALWSTVEAGGDNDTNCAIVGGIVILANGRESIPTEWFEAAEMLPIGSPAGNPDRP